MFLIKVYILSEANPIWVWIVTSAKNVDEFYLKYYWHICKEMVKFTSKQNDEDLLSV